MKLVKCLKCGNQEGFYEEAYVLQRNDFIQNRNGKIRKTGSETGRNCSDSRIFCSTCNEEIEEDRDLFLDRYSDTIFSSVD